MSDEQVEKATAEPTTDEKLQLIGEALVSLVDALIVFCEKYPDAPVVAARQLRESLSNLSPEPRAE